MTDKERRPSRKEITKFRTMRYDPKSWAIRAKTYLESNLDKFKVDNPEEAKLTSEEYIFHFMMDASRQRYTRATILQLEEILMDNRTNHGFIITTEIRVEWACQYIAGVGVRL